MQAALDDLGVGVGERVLPVLRAADTVDDKAGLGLCAEDFAAVELVWAQELDAFEARLLEQLEIGEDRAACWFRA